MLNKSRFKLLKKVRSETKKIRNSCQFETFDPGFLRGRLINGKEKSGNYFTVDVETQAFINEKT